MRGLAGIGVVLAAALLAALPARAAEDLLIADFEATDYGAWKAEGEAFGPGPARGTMPGQMEVGGFEGKGLVNSFHKGDKSTGALTSPPFKIERKFINFLIGGGKDREKTCMHLIIDGKVVRTATGPNDRPGGTERLDWDGWDVAEFAGKTATLQIVDQATGGWGHINVDHIVQSDRKRSIQPAQREMTMEQPYLHLPVKNGARKCRMRLAVDDKTVREFEIELALGEPDFWVFADVSAFKGQRLTVHVDRLADGEKALAAIVQSDSLPGAAKRYKEKLRPQFHFSPRVGWNNDPNGLVFHKGEYHLYFQHNPFGWNWGNMHWGHAVSADLVHWKELPIAIYPYKFGDWVFSGSAVVDSANTAGFKTGAEDVIVAAYTSTGRGEAIAYSNDRGRTFTDYPGNPVVKHAGRDPKLIWYAPGRHWVMAVYDEFQGKQYIAFHTSTDLKTWQFQSRIEGYFECPEIFELAIDGDPGKTRWVVYAADGAYAIGTFDGKTFTTESGKHPFNYGNAFYASQTYSDIPAADGRRIQIAWGRIATPGMPFNQCMLFPVELTLRTTDEGLRLFAVPVREIEKLRGKSHSWKNEPLKAGTNPLPGIGGDLFDIRAEFDVAAAAEVGLNIRGTPVVFDAKAGELRCKGQKAPLKAEGGRIRLQVLVDRTSIEVYANGGRVYMPVGVIHPDDKTAIETIGAGAAKIVSLEVHELKSSW
ncbi:MAG: GH32 C-terminal domain-containing protein [Planctomycetes bacterium]|nr:GH32 C-terminal domain-containing protein [Planctomycetota bacterium]